MDANAMLQAAVWLLAIAAAGGVVMAGVRFARKVNPPAWLSMLHGFLAASALTLIAAAAFGPGAPGMATIALALLALAALGGVVLNLNYQWKQRLLPASIVAGHAVLAVAGFACLVMAAYPG